MLLSATTYGNQSVHFCVTCYVELLNAQPKCIEFAWYLYKRIQYMSNSPIRLGCIQLTGCHRTTHEQVSTNACSPPPPPHTHNQTHKWKLTHSNKHIQTNNDTYSQNTDADPQIHGQV